MPASANPLPEIDVAAVANRMLTAIVDYFTTRDWDLPERRYIAAGLPTMIADDDEHLAVCLSSMSSGVSQRATTSISGVQARGARSMHVPRANFGVRVIRCISSDVSPSAEELQADGERVLADPGRLLTALFHWVDTDNAAYATNPMTTIGDVEPFGPMGGVAGHIIKVVVGPVQ
jgi:hypothetical protein